VPSPVAGGWQLNGSAALVASASPPNLQVTPATNYVAGSAFWPTPVPGAGITAAFDEFIGPGSGADGMTFTLADASVTQPTALGGNGGAEGFAGISGVAVSLDTWQNANDPSSNFVGIATSSPGQPLTYVTTNATIPSLIGAVHHFVVATTASGLTVSMDGTQVLSSATTLAPYVLVGFTGATGGFNDVHQVQNVSITAGPPPPMPKVTSVNPGTGPTTGGTIVTIGGSGFTGATAVNFGSVAATNFSVASDTSITATAPAGTGTVDVTVAATWGTSATGSADQFTYVVPPPPPTNPAVTAVTASTGPSGSLVTVSGVNFTGATAVLFGTAGAAFVVDNDGTISATVPPGSGTVDVTVTTPSGTSPTGTGDRFTYGAGPPPGTVPSPVAGGWQLNGSAQLVTTASPPNLEVTPATNWAAGSAFWPTPVPGAGITAAFDEFIGPGAGADGMTFTLADAGVTPPTALGSNGGGEGFAGITGVAVSLDTWQNAADPSSNFVGISTTSSGQR
jgi:hypothetical protein